MSSIVVLRPIWLAVVVASVCLAFTSCRSTRPCCHDRCPEMERHHGHEGGRHQGEMRREHGERREHGGQREPGGQEARGHEPQRRDDGRQDLIHGLEMGLQSARRMGDGEAIHAMERALDRARRGGQVEVRREVRAVFVDSDRDGLPDRRVGAGGGERRDGHGERSERFLFVDSDKDGLPDRRIGAGGGERREVGHGEHGGHGGHDERSGRRPAGDGPERYLQDLRREVEDLRRAVQALRESLQGRR